MRPKISIRPAKANDVCETATMFSAALRGMTFFPKLYSDEEDRTFIARQIAECETWVAEAGGHVAGLVVLDASWLNHLYVDPAQHNRGIGSALLCHVKAQRPRGFQLWTFQANTGAQRFYERHGCIVSECTDGSRNEEKLPDMRYVWCPPGEA